MITITVMNGKIPLRASLVTRTETLPNYTDGSSGFTRNKNGIGKPAENCESKSVEGRECESSLPSSGKYTSSKT